MNKYLEDKKGKKNCIVGDLIFELKNTKIGKNILPVRKMVVSLHSKSNGK